MNRKKMDYALKFLDTWLTYRYTMNDWTGFTVAISHKNEIVFNKSYGYAHVESHEKLSPHHIFRIASHSKTFTAVAIMQLVEKKKMKLDDPIVTFLPWLLKHRDKRFQTVTVRQLLSHNAGIIRDGLDANYWLLTRQFPNKEQFVQEVLEADLVFNSGKKMKYSNFGFGLLGLVIEEVSGIPYNEYVTKHIINPLGLKNTGPEYAEKIDKKLVTGYSRKGGKKRKPFPKDIDTGALSAATGFYSTSEDLCTYFNALMEGSGELLSDNSKKIMFNEAIKVPKAENEKYGLGLIFKKIGKYEFFGHGGGFPGHSTKTFCDPKNKLVITVLIPVIDGNVVPFAEGIVSILNYFEKNYVFDEGKELDKFEGIYSNIFSITQIVSMGNHLVGMYPNVFKPFDEIGSYKYKNKNTLQIGSTNGYYSEGELVHYEFNKTGKVKSITLAGYKMVPEK